MDKSDLKWLVAKLEELQSGMEEERAAWKKALACSARDLATERAAHKETKRQRDNLSGVVDDAFDTCTRFESELAETKAEAERDRDNRLVADPRLCREDLLFSWEAAPHTEKGEG